VSSEDKKNTLFLHKLINKAPTITIASGSRLCGDFGHGTAIFKRPLIEGLYYLEFIIKPDVPKTIPVKYSSSVRVGICLPNMNPAFPLGWGESIAFRSADGSLFL